MEKNARAMLLVLSLSAAGANAQGLIAYDGFGNGPRTDLDGSNGGTGWTTPWAHVGGTIRTRIRDAGAHYLTLMTAPGGAFTPPSPGGVWEDSIYERGFGPYPAPPEDRLYVSFLLRPEIGFGPYGGLAFGVEPRRVFVGIPYESGAYGLRFEQGPVLSTGIPAVEGETAFLVLEIQTLPPLQKRYRLYLNSGVAGPRPPVPDAEHTIADAATLPEWVTLSNDGGYTTDEIRIGTTWAGVVLERSPCYPDCDRSTGNGTLDIFDFLCFQNAYVVQDPYACDCDSGTGQSVCDIFDFLCFQNAFAAGCR